MNKIPNYAMSPRGKVRILEYIGNGIFRVLAARDVVYHMHRSKLTMLKG